MFTHPEPMRLSVIRHEGRVALRLAQWLGDERKGTRYDHVELLVVDDATARWLVEQLQEVLR